MSVVEVVEKEVAVPGDVQLTVKDRFIEVKGPRGIVSEDLSHLPVEITQKGNKVAVKVTWPRKREVAFVGTAASLIANMIKGVTQGFTYKLKVVYAHFPTTIKIDRGKRLLTIENFMGEKVPRRVTIVGDADVQVQGDEVIVKGIRLQDVSQTAANIERATKIKQKDQRVFLDGVYVYTRREEAS